MNVGSMRRAAPWVVVFLAAWATGCRSCAREGSPNPTEEVVWLNAEYQDTAKNWKAIAHPDLRIVHGYVAEKRGPTVIWPYFHLYSHIKFADSRIPDPTCPPGTHKCTLELPKGLTPKVRYKYTVTGKLDDTTDLAPNDPWIEVDR